MFGYLLLDIDICFSTATSSQSFNENPAFASSDAERLVMVLVWIE